MGDRKREKMVSIELTREHAFVFFVAIGGYIVNQILGNLVNVARGRFKIPVPFLYANHGMFLKDGKIDEVALKTRGVAFNRVQRGHQHLFESHADFYALLLLAGLLYPESAYKAGVLYLVGSLVYGIGYARNASLRLVGEAIYYPGIFWLLYLVGYTGYSLL